MAEDVFYDSDSVKVTNARFVVDNQTYAMNGVTSVRGALVPANHTLAIVMIVIGVLLLLGGGGGAKVIGIVIAAIGGYLIYANKPTHVVILHSASGETRALTSKDPTVISSVIAALNESLIHRG
jgi:hypothetical protein